MNNRFLLAVLFFAGFQARILANGFSLSDQDAFATARGGAFVATADNASAIYYNPAGIAQLENNNLQGGVYGIYLDPTFTPPSGAANAGTTYHNGDNWAAVPQAFYTHTFTNTILSLGLGVYAPFGGSIEWPQNTGFRTVATQGKLTYYTINPVAALKLAPNLFIGAGLSANYVDLFMDQGLVSSGPPNNFQFKGNGWSLGYNLGALWQPIKQISFGGTFRGAEPVTLDGHTKFIDVPFIPNTSLPAHMALTFPLSAVVGASYRPTPKWNVEFDATYTAWSSFGTTTLYQEKQPPIGINKNINVNLNWQDSWMYQFGVTRYFGKGWQVSAGYVFDENSVPNAFYSPLAADMDRHFFSIGFGRNGKLINFDVTYQFGYGPEHTVTGSTPSSTPGLFAFENANGKYAFTSSALMVTVGVHF